MIVTCIYVYIMCVYACMCVCVCMCMYVCMYVCNQRHLTGAVRYVALPIAMQEVSFVGIQLTTYCRAP